MFWLHGIKRETSSHSLSFVIDQVHPEISEEFSRIFDMTNLGGLAVGASAGSVVEPTAVRGRRLGCPLGPVEDVSDGISCRG